MIKRVLSVIICLALLLCLIGCGENGGKSNLTKINGNTVDIEAIAQQNNEQNGTAEAPGNMQEYEQSQEALSDSGDTAYSERIDVDLTQMSSTMVYSEVSNMMGYPEEYVGKIIKARGTFADFTAEDSTTYFAVIIADATACCQQGLEFVWNGEHSYPEDYPQYGDLITIVGEFGVYEEDGLQYCQLSCDDVHLGF